MKASLTERLGAFVANTNLDDIPPGVIERATISLIHNLTIAMAGRTRETVCHIMAKRYWEVPKVATLLHDGTRVSVEAAAFANGALMHARSQDDTHASSTSHPGTPVIAAALAVAEADGRTGAEFLAAVILGYEILGRVGRDFDHLVSKRGFRSAAAAGGFGAAAAAAKLMRLSPAETAHALGLVANLAGGLSQVWEEGSAEYPLQLGGCARNGILAARAAQVGATAARQALEGKSGFYFAFAGASEPANEVLNGLGQTWQLSEVTVKLYPVCAILQGPVGSMLHLARSHDVSPDAVSKVVLDLSPYEAIYPGIDNAGPFASSTSTKMSAQFSLAASLLERRLTLNDLTRTDDTTIGSFASRVSVGSDPNIRPRQSRLQIHLHNGRVLSDIVSVPVGQPTLDEIRTFARSLAEEIGLTTAEIDRIFQEIESLRSADSLKPLINAITHISSTGANDQSCYALRTTRRNV